MYQPLNILFSVVVRLLILLINKLWSNWIDDSLLSMCTKGSLYLACQWWFTYALQSSREVVLQRFWCVVDECGVCRNQVDRCVQKVGQEVCKWSICCEGAYTPYEKLLMMLVIVVLSAFCKLQALLKIVITFCCCWNVTGSNWERADRCSRWHHVRHCGVHHGHLERCKELKRFVSLLLWITTGFMIIRYSFTQTTTGMPNYIILVIQVGWILHCTKRDSCCRLQFCHSDSQLFCLQQVPESAIYFIEDGRKVPASGWLSYMAHSG